MKITETYIGAGFSNDYQAFTPFNDVGIYLINDKQYKYKCRCQGWDKHWNWFVFEEIETRETLMIDYKDKEAIENILIV